MQMCGPNNVGKAVQTVPTLLHYALPSRNKRNVGSFWLKSLTGFKLCATTLNNMQQGVQTDATCNIQHCWELLANNVTSICKRVKAWSPLLTASTVKKCHLTIYKRGNYKVSLPGGCSTIHHGCCYSSGSGCQKRLKIKGTRNYYYFLNNRLLFQNKRWEPSFLKKVLCNPARVLWYYNNSYYKGWGSFCVLN